MTKVFTSDLCNDIKFKRCLTIVSIIVLMLMVAGGLYKAKVEANRARIALAHQLTAQAQSVLATDSSKYTTAILLATQSMNISPSNEAAQILINDNFVPSSISRITPDNASSTVAFSPDRKYAASKGDYHTIHVWEVSTGKEIAYMIHDGVVNSISFSQDGKYLVSGSDDKTARIWETTTGKEIIRLVHSHFVVSVIFSSNGKYVMTGTRGFDLTAHIWEATTGKEIATYSNDRSEIPATSIAFGPNDKYVEFKVNDKVVRMWDILTGTEVPHDVARTSVAFSSDGRYMASDNEYDDTVRVWKVEKGKKASLIIQVENMHFVAFMSNGKYVVLGGKGGIHIWDFVMRKEITSILQPSLGPFMTISQMKNMLHQVDGTENILLAFGKSPLGRKSLA